MKASIRFARTALLAALLYLLAASLAPSAFGWGTLSAVVLIGGFFVLSCFVNWKLASVTASTPLGLYFGLTFGIVLNATLDLSLRGIDHNLLPFEIFGFWVVVGPSIAFGMVAGRWLRRARSPVRSW